MSKATDFLIDNSDKMDKKVRVAQTVMNKCLIPNFDASSAFGMRTFKSVVGSPIIIKQLDLKEKNDKATFEDKVNKLPLSSGGCPLAVALKESMEELNSRDEEVKKIFLITAGEDTDGGVPEYEVENIAGNVQVNIVGIGMKDRDLNAAEKIAQQTKGACCNIPEDKFSDDSAIQAIVAPVVDAMKSITFVAAPKPQPVATPKEEAPKMEPVQIAQPEAPRMAAFVAQPTMATTKVELPKTNNSQSATHIQSASVAHVEKEEFDAIAEAQKTADSIQIQLQTIISDVTEQLKGLYANIPSLVANDKQTIQKLIKSNESTVAENQALRNAEAQNIKSIDELKTINEEATGTISQLMQVIEDQRSTEEQNKKILEEISAERQKAAGTIAQLNQTIAQKEAQIKALEENKISMQAAIDELIGKLSSLR